jgi:diacylglycerol kinase (ATP)
MDKFSIKKRFKSFEYAYKGLIHAIKTQHNIWIHIAATVIIVYGGFHYAISPIEWSIILLCIGLVLSAEIINSSIESLTDMVSPEYDKLAGKVKDMAAGAVLFAAIIAAIVGFIIFIPKM